MRLAQWWAGGWGARGRWRSFSRDGCERVAFLAADDCPRPTGLMIAWEM